MAIKIIKKVSKEDLKEFIYDMDLEDPLLYDELNRDNTIGLFQLDGAAARQITKKINPRNFEELSAISALARPGTMENSLRQYINSKNGQLPNYPKKMLDLLKDTYGTILYQEQVMELFNKLGGFTLTEAEEVRGLMKVLSRKEKKEEDIKNWEIVVNKFADGCAENDIARNDAEKIAEDIQAFSSYSFNKSHCTSYSMITCSTLYFSVYFRNYFYTSLLSYENGDEEILKKIIEIKNHGVDILPPDINKSEENFSILDGKIYFGLSNIKGLGDKATKRIIDNRPYTNFFDFYNRTKSMSVNKRVVARLIKAGAFDSIENLDRKVLLKVFTEFKENLPNNREPDIFYEESYNKYKYSMPINEDELVEFDRESFGFNCFYSKFTTSNVISILEKDKGKIYYNIGEIDERPRRIPLLVNSSRKIIDKNNMEMLFLDCSDMSGEKVSLPLFGSMYRFITTEIEDGEIYYFLVHERNNQTMFFSNKRIYGAKNNILVSKIS